MGFTGPIIPRWLLGHPSLGMFPLAHPPGHFVLPSLSAAWMAKDEAPDAGLEFALSAKVAQVPHKARNSTTRPL